METSLTTLVCLAEMLSWDELTSAQRGVQGLGGMYGGYLAAGKLPIRVLSSPRPLKRMRDIFP
jgi:hypothetical protein